jgi:dUTP pyrophosphatase
MRPEGDGPHVLFTRLPHGIGLAGPGYASAGAAGADLCAACPADEPITIASGTRALVPTGLCLAIPRGWEGQVRPRSGLAHGHGVTVLNAPGTIDADYRGEIKVLLINFGSETFTIERGQRIAQLVIAPCAHAVFQAVDTLDPTERGGGGFGSTGGFAGA